MNFRSLENVVTDYCSAKVELWEHLKTRLQKAMEFGRSRRAALTTPADLAAHTARMRECVLKSFGAPQFGRTAPSHRHRGAVPSRLHHPEAPAGTPPRRIGQRPSLPSRRARPPPAILFLCDHSAKTKQAHHKVCQVFAQTGFIVMALDPVGQGERVGYLRPGSADPVFGASPGHEYVGLQCTLQGHNLARYMIHDAIRAVDYLSAHPAVDPRRIGLTGNSGGGLQTSLMLLLEPRIAAAAPGTFFSSFEAVFDTGFRQNAEQNWRGVAGEGYDHVALLPDEYDNICAQMRGYASCDYYGMGLMPAGSGTVGFLWNYWHGLPYTTVNTPGKGYSDNVALYGVCDVSLVYQPEPGGRWLHLPGRPTFIGRDYPWTKGMVFTASSPIEVGDEQWLYITGKECEHGFQLEPDWNPSERRSRLMPAFPSRIGLVRWPKYRLFGLESSREGALTVDLGRITEPVELRLNYKTAYGGSIRAEILDHPGFCLAECKPLVGDALSEPVAWACGSCIIPKAPNTPLRIRLHIESATLYAYQIVAVAR